MGCSKADSPIPQQPEANTETAPTELDSLQALGYVDYVATNKKHGPTGARVHQADAIQPGLNFFSIHSPCEARLIDVDGKILHTWSRDGNVWGHAELLTDGSIVVPAKEDDGSFLLKLDWNNQLVWRQPIQAHHDVEVLPDGSLATLSSELRSIPSISTEHEIRDDLLVQMNSKGEIQTEYSLATLLNAQAEWEWETVQPSLVTRDKSIIDLIHANSIVWMHPGWAKLNPLFQEGNVMVSMRHQNRVVILHPENGELLWSYGRGEILGQHDATVLENGNILIFDNGLSRGWSRVIEVDPNSKEIVWQWSAPEREAFYTAGRGAAQRLANGNTLLLESDQGHAIEITKAGKVVWEYTQPPNEDGKTSTIVRMKRYALNYLNDLLQQ